LIVFQGNLPVDIPRNCEGGFDLKLIRWCQTWRPIDAVGGKMYSVDGYAMIQ